MIAKYKGEYYLAVRKTKKLKIWRYTFAEGFDKFVYDSGLQVFKKEVLLTDLDELFTPVFAVSWRGNTYRIMLSHDSKAVALCLDSDISEYTYEYTIQYDKILEEHYFVVPVDDCDEFYLTKSTLYPERKTRTATLSKEDWIAEYRKLVTEFGKLED